MSPIKSLGNSRAKYNYKFGLTGLEAVDPYVPPPGPVYSDDVFKIHLYDGTGSTQTITNGIDLNGKGGLVWIKERNDTQYHQLFSREVGLSTSLATNTPNQASTSSDITSFNSDGFTLATSNGTNKLDSDFVSWTFRKQPGFFTIKKWVGDGQGDRYLDHDLDSRPSFVIVKNLTDSQDWGCYHKSLGAGIRTGLALNQTYESGNNSIINPCSSVPTSSQIHIRGDYNTLDKNYVAYLFGDDDMRFGTDRNESIIKCGDFTAHASGVSVYLGWEPQFVMWKTSNVSGNWHIQDMMRGMSYGPDSGERLFPNTGDDEDGTFVIGTNPTGFDVKPSFYADNTSIVYIAIRRPHKPITDPTKLFDLVLQNSANPNLLDINTSVADMVFYKQLNSTNSNSIQFADRMRGVKRLWPYDNLAETTDNNYAWDYNDKVQTSFYSAGNSQINHIFRRAPGFFDVVAYSGSNSSQTLNHNLGVKPALMICKRRNSTGNWQVYADIPNMGSTKYMMLDDSAGAVANTNRWNDTEPTAMHFTLGTYSDLNTSGGEYISYLFGNLPGVCKIGEYTSGSDAIDVDCGFNPRFVMIKRVDAGAGNWFVWHSINAGNDSYILLNDNVVGVSNTDWIDPISNGFQVAAVSTGISNNLNLSPARPFLFMAIA